MKITFLILLTLFSCKKVQKKSLEVVSKNIDSISLPKKNDSSSINKISFCDKELENKNIYKYFIDVDNLKYLNKIDMKEHNFVKRELFDMIFNTENLECISLISDKEQTKIYEFFYHDLYAEKVIDNILKINVDTTLKNQYHDFFKRGIIFAQGKINKNNLTVIVFNPLANPKIIGHIDEALKKNQMNLI